MAIILNDTFAFLSERFTITTTQSGHTTMVSEASVIGYHGPLQIYDDACDVGIAVRSHKTGRTLRFYLSTEDRDDSGENVAGWWFKMIPEDRCRLSSQCREVDVLIIND
jgi:hypothetical protein